MTATSSTSAPAAARSLARITVPSGPVMWSRATMLESRGFEARGQRSEELVVVEGRGADG